MESSKEENKTLVEEDDVALIVANQTGIPVNRLTEKETAKVLNMNKTIKEHIIGQEDALNQICKAIRRSRADIKDPKKPIGSFLFLGPTGVGKTLLAKLIAKHMFGGEDSLIQLDMSEYMEKFSASRITGSPPGYVGHEEGGQLTEKVRQRPYCVILFDEIEKAHSDVMNILLQILEDGHLTDSLGREINFKNTIIIMTSNLGADLLKKSEMGFSAKSGLDKETMKKKVETAVDKYFKPEFINRLDEKIVFNPLSKDDMKKIVELELNKLKLRLKNKNISLTFDDNVNAFIVLKGHQPEMGARPLKRAIEQHIEDGLAERLLLDPDSCKEYLITIENKKITFKDVKTKKDDKECEVAP